MELRREVITTEILDPRHGFEPRSSSIELRWDPLTGHTSRLFEPRGLMADTQGLEDLAKQTEPACPFCVDRIEQQTPRFPPDVVPAGRIRRGEAVLFPNLHGYAALSSVSAYSPRLHFLPLGAMTERLVVDNLLAQIAFVRAAQRARADAVWSSVNANHMPPSGSALFHPHLQGLVDPRPTTMQRLLLGVSDELVTEYVEAEQREGHRWLGSTGRVAWLCAFAPIGPAEIRAFVPGAVGIAEVPDDLAEEVGRGIAAVLALYSDLGFESFNLAMYGAPPGTRGYVLSLRMVARANPRPHVRSDATHLERLHWEAGIDVWPERVAEAGRRRFEGLG
jgi:galactose-1-phosphate uridylyltransferase